jgi:uncharacterized protein YjiS (DUF1127 family)
MSYKAASTFLQTSSAVFRNVIAIIVVASREKIAATIERRRTRFALNALDDYMLKDMGISRTDIERIANRSYPPREVILTGEAGRHSSHP